MTCPVVKFKVGQNVMVFSNFIFLWRNFAFSLRPLYLVLIIVLHNASQPKWFSTSVQVFNKELGSTCQHFSLCTSCQPSCRELSNIPITWNQHLIFCSTLNNFSVIWMSDWDYPYNAGCSVWDAWWEWFCAMVDVLFNLKWSLVSCGSSWVILQEAKLINLSIYWIMCHMLRHRMGLKMLKRLNLPKKFG